MATVFQRGEVWLANVRYWVAAEGRWKWKQVATGCGNRSAALAVALQLEDASLAAKAGKFSRERALDLVSDLLRLAGLPLVAGCPDTWEFAREMAERPGLAGKSLQKYGACFESFKAWAGNDRPLDGWSAGEFQRWYDQLLGSVSPGTAYAHLRFWRSVFTRAMKLGHVRVNPASGVVCVASESEGKVPLTRLEVGRLLWFLHRHILKRDDRARRDSWLCLVLLGWHTGHRIQDLLGLTAESVKEEQGVGLVVSWIPAKTAGRGARRVVLPVPRHVGLMLRRLGDLKVLGRAGSNYNGKVSNEFVELLAAAGVDPLPKRFGASGRVTHLKSFHSFRHAMSSRLAAAGVSGQTARLVTGHESEQVHAGYVHAEVVSLAGALKAARRK